MYADVLCRIAIKKTHTMKHTTIIILSLLLTHGAAAQVDRNTFERQR